MNMQPKAARILQERMTGRKRERGRERERSSSSSKCLSARWREIITCSLVNTESAERQRLAVVVHHQDFAVENEIVGSLEGLRDELPEVSHLVSQDRLQAPGKVFVLVALLVKLDPLSVVLDLCNQSVKH